MPVVSSNSGLFFSLRGQLIQNSLSRPSEESGGGWGAGHLGGGGAQIRPASPFLTTRDPGSACLRPNRPFALLPRGLTAPCFLSCKRQASISSACVRQSPPSPDLGRAAWPEPSKLVPLSNGNSWTRLWVVTIQRERGRVRSAQRGACCRAGAGELGHPRPPPPHSWSCLGTSPSCSSFARSLARLPL